MPLGAAHGSDILQEVWAPVGILGSMVSRLWYTPWENRALPLLRK
jgi:hypothetical protein